MKKYKFLFIVVLGLIILIPKSSNAYFSTHQSAQQFGDKVLFTVTYQFGTADYDLYMPIMAVRDLGIDNKTNNLGFTILDNKIATSTTAGKTNALVLAKLPIKGDQYFIPHGTRAEFNLITILDTKNVANNSNLSLLVTSLPFTMVEPADTVKAHLNPTELQYYVTPKILLK